MTRRFVKQLMYGALFLVVFYLMGWGVYAAWIQPAPSCFDNRQNGVETGVDCGGGCEACAIRTLSPLQVSWTRMFDAGTKAVAVSEIRNPNTGYGARSFDYILHTADSSGRVYDNSGTSFIYGEEIKYLVQFFDDQSLTHADLTIATSTMRWVASADFPRPVIQVRAITTTVKEDGISMEGFIKNENPYSLSRLTVIALLFNQGGLHIGASQTELGLLPAFEEVPFTVIFPPTFLISSSVFSTPSSTAIFAPSNIVDPKNIKVYVEAAR